MHHTAVRDFTGTLGLLRLYLRATGLSLPLWVIARDPQDTVHHTAVRDFTGTLGLLRLYLRATGLSLPLWVGDHRQRRLRLHHPRTPVAGASPRPPATSTEGASR